MHQLRHPLPGPGDRADLGAERVVIFACGQGLRGDDAVALDAVGHLPADVRRLVTVRRVGALAPEDLVAVAPAARVVIADAIVGPAPGTVVHIDLAELSAPRTRLERRFTASSHQLPLGDVVALGRLLRDAPLTGSFVGLAIGSVTADAPLSDAVRAALPAFREALAAAVRAAT
jgi:hydrogenase maturation protease